MEGRDYRCSAVTNATFNHRECPRERPSKKSPQWFRSRTGRSSIGNVQACAHGRSHLNGMCHELDVQASGMSKRASTQEVTTMILVTNATYFHRDCPSVSARKKSPQ